MNRLALIWDKLPASAKAAIAAAATMIGIGGVFLTLVYTFPYGVIGLIGLVIFGALFFTWLEAFE